MNALIIFAAKYLIILSPLLVIVSWILRDKTQWKKPWICFALTVVITGGLGFVANHLYFHDRPFVVNHVTPLIPHAADNGFPSDHTLLAAGIAAGLWFTSKRLSAVAWIVTILVGAARVLALVHWPVDIIGSLAVALVAALISPPIVNRFLTRSASGT